MFESSFLSFFLCNVNAYVSWQRCRYHIVFFPISLSTTCATYVARFALRMFENKKTLKRTLRRLKIYNLIIACLFKILWSPPYLGQNLRTRTRTRKTGKIKIHNNTNKEKREKQNERSAPSVQNKQCFSCFLFSEVFSDVFKTCATCC